MLNLMKTAGLIASVLLTVGGNAVKAAPAQANADSSALDTTGVYIDSNKTDHSISSLLSQELIELCMPVDNCTETIKIAINHLTIEGELTKRDWCDGRGKWLDVKPSTAYVKYGSVNPYDALHHAYDLCGFSSCDSGRNFDVATNIPSQFNMASSIPVKATGFYPGWEYRNAYIEAVVGAISAKDVQAWGQEYYYVHYERVTDRRGIWQSWAPNSVNVASWNNCQMNGWMTVKTRGVAGQTSSGQCSALTGALAGLIGNPAISALVGWVSATACGSFDW